MPQLTGHLAIITVGKLRGAHWQAAQDDYLKRLHRYVDVSLVEVKDAVGRLPDPVAMQREGEQLLQAAAPFPRKIALTSTGRQLTSPALADFLQKQIELYGRVAFLIGGPLGFSDDLLAAGDEQLSLSLLTFPHELARVVLLEQLYRAFTILQGEKYHK